MILLLYLSSAEIPVQEAPNRLCRERGLWRVLEVQLLGLGLSSRRLKAYGELGEWSGRAELPTPLPLYET